MKFLALLSVFLALPLFGQTAPPAPTPAPAAFTNLYAGGVSYNSVGHPSVAGTALYAHAVDASSGTYAFTVIDALEASKSPFTVTTNIGAGIAQKLFTIGKTSVYVPTSAGISFTGSNTGWAWSTGAMVPIKLKGNWRILPNVRLQKSSVGGGGYQPIAGLLFGWGQ